MQAITTLGLDIAKSVFQVHGVDAAGNVIIRRQLKRRYVLVFFEKLPPCLIGIEACASSHHWSRELQALGHTVRLMPPAYVKPYVKRHKNDAIDAEAICEAVTLTRIPPYRSGKSDHVGDDVGDTGTGEYRRHGVRRPEELALNMRFGHWLSYGSFRGNRGGQHFGKDRVSVVDIGAQRLCGRFAIMCGQCFDDCAVRHV
jgi:hypothetical protein